MIQFDNLSKRYATGFDALKNVSLHMDAGELAFLTVIQVRGKALC